MKFLLAFAFTVCSISWVGGPATSSTVIEEFQAFHQLYPQEKVYMHFDKAQYVLGEHIWAKVYLVDAIFHQTVTPSQQVYVELIGPDNDLFQRKLIWIEDGGGQVDFFLKPQWPQGKYLLRAYTNYMRNFLEPFFFEKEIAVYDAYAGLRAPGTGEHVSPPAVTARDHEVAEPEVRFYPEGGDLVAGLQSLIGVRAQSGIEGVPVSGKILSNGKAVATFSTHASGLGFCTLVPDHDRRYIAEVDYNGSVHFFDLPDVLERGYRLHLNQIRDTILIEVETNHPAGFDNAYMLGHVRGDLFCAIEGITDSRATFKIPSSPLPDGVAHFTLFDQSVPVAERLTFIYNHDAQPVVTMQLDQGAYQKRQRVDLSMEVLDADGQPLSVNGSLTVTDVAVVPRHVHAQDIRTHLLLESDLRGPIKAPAAYFEDSAAQRKLLDLVMLTHGWRRFDWQDLLSKSKVRLDWFPENDISISGYVTKLGKKDRAVKANVYLSTLSEEFTMQKKVTNTNGEFEFRGFQFHDSVTLMFQADVYNDKRKEAMARRRAKRGEGPVGKRQLDIYLDPVFLPGVDRSNAQVEPPVASDAFDIFLEASRRVQTVDSAYADIVNVELEEVVIAEEKYDERAEYLKNRGMLYSEPDQRLVIDSIPFGSLATNVFDLIQGKFPGVEVLGTFPNKTVRIRGINSISLNSTAMIMLDGLPVDPGLANLIPVQNIAFVDIISSLSKTAGYGAAGSNGIVAIYRKRPGEHAPAYRVVNGILHYTHPGYYQALRFESPAYAPEVPDSKPDFRTTLHWEPRVATDPDGRFNLTFYTADRATVYAVRLEGIGDNGQPVVAETTFFVN